MGAGSSGGVGPPRKRQTQPDVNISCPRPGSGESKDVRPWKVKVSMFHKLSGSLRKFSSGCAKVFK